MPDSGHCCRLRELSSHEHDSSALTSRRHLSLLSRDQNPHQRSCHSGERSVSETQRYITNLCCFHMRKYLSLNQLISKNLSVYTDLIFFEK